MKMIITDYYTQVYDNKLDYLAEMGKILTHMQIPKMNYVETEGKKFLAVISKNQWIRNLGRHKNKIKCRH